MIQEALSLLEQATPRAADLPARIEELNLAAFDVSEHITNLSDLAGRREEDATAEAASESNADRRKVRRCEILRDDATYQQLRAEIQEAERVKVRLEERSHRHAREHRLIVAEKGREL